MKTSTLPMRIRTIMKPWMTNTGHFLGKIIINDMGFHVEAIEVNEIENSLPKAKNPIYQDRIEAWGKLNTREIPSLMAVGRKKYFIHVEAWSQ